MKWVYSTCIYFTECIQGYQIITFNLFYGQKKLKKNL